MCLGVSQKVSRFGVLRDFDFGGIGSISEDIFEFYELVFFVMD
jgi:hypothetical protein